MNSTPQLGYHDRGLPELAHEGHLLLKSGHTVIDIADREVGAHPGLGDGQVPQGQLLLERVDVSRKLARHLGALIAGQGHLAEDLAVADRWHQID